MKTKVRSVEMKEYNGKKSYTVVLENGVSGYLNSQGSDNISEGNEVTYALEVKKNKKGQDYNLLTVKLVSETTQKGNTTETKTEPSLSQYDLILKQTKCKAAIEMMQEAQLSFRAGKLDWDEIAVKQREVTKLLWSEFDEIFGIK